MNRIQIFILGVLLLSFSGCGEDEVIPKPENLLPEETYINLMVELQLFDALVYTNEDSTYTDSLREELFNHYKISENQFLQSNTYYQSKPDEHAIRIDSALKKIEREQKKLHQSEDERSGSERI